MSNSAIQLPSPVGTGIEDLRGGLRTRFINGNFRVWQRNITFSAPTGPVVVNTEFYTSDRWVWGFNGDGGSLTSPTSKIDRGIFVLGQTEVPGNPLLFLEWTTEILGGGGNELSNLVQRIEQVKTLSGQKVTFSFWAKGTSSGDILVNTRQFFGSGGSVPVQSTFIPITLTTSWKRYVVVMDLPSILGKTIGANNNHLAVKFTSILAATVAATLGTVPVNFTGTISIAQVQFEEGEIVDPVFETLALAQQIILVQRYYHQSANIGNIAPFSTALAGAIGFEADATGFGGSARTIMFPTKMRGGSPSISIWSFSSGVPNEASHTGVPSPNITVTPNLTNIPGENGFTIDYGNPPGPIAVPNFNYNFHYVADAEV